MVTINEQALLFLACVKIGMMMGVLYDLVRILRKLMTHPNWLVQVEDLLYWITCGCFAFVMIYWENYGQIRSFVFLGILIGVILYFCIASQWVIKALTQMIKHFIFMPIKCIMNIMRIPIAYLCNIYIVIDRKRKIHKSKKQLKWEKRRARLKKQLNIIKMKK